MFANNVNGSIRKQTLTGTGFKIIIATVLIHLVFYWLGWTTELVVVVFGIPFSISLLTLILFVLFFVDGFVYIKKHHEGLDHISYTFAAVAAVLIVVASLLAHEFNHGIVATVLGHPITKSGISWWGAYVMPNEPINEMAPYHQILISIAGPATNVVIALVAALIVKIHGESLFENMVQYVAVINMRLAIWNMFPVFFLDGGKAVDGVLRLFVTDQSTRMWILSGFVVVWYLIRRRHTSRENYKSFEESIATL